MFWIYSFASLVGVLARLNMAWISKEALGFGSLPITSPWATALKSHSFDRYSPQYCLTLNLSRFVSDHAHRTLTIGAT